MTNMNERYNYIVLDSEQATYDATGQANWEILDYYYSDYQAGDDMYIELISCTFSGYITGAPTSGTATIMINGLNIYNQQNTQRDQILDIIPISIFLSGDETKFISPSNTNANNLKLKTNRFFNIGISVKYETQTADIDFYNTSYKFILKVSYQKP